jgi:TonB family protein
MLHPGSRFLACSTRPAVLGRSTRRLRFAAAALGASMALTRCAPTSDGDSARSVARDSVRIASSDPAVSGDRDVPKMLNAQPPFRYPAGLYARKVQANVLLRLHVDTTGHVRAESTSVAESSGYAALDAAALRGAALLTFAPARRAGRPVPANIRFPVYFRHPSAPPLPGDTISRRGAGQ